MNSVTFPTRAGGLPRLAQVTGTRLSPTRVCFHAAFHTRPNPAQVHHRQHSRVCSGFRGADVGQHHTRIPGESAHGQDALGTTLDDNTSAGMARLTRPVSTSSIGMGTSVLRTCCSVEGGWSWCHRTGTGPRTLFETKVLEGCRPGGLQLQRRWFLVRWPRWGRSLARRDQAFKANKLIN
jgi:hypothetical protein